eukprot:689889-Rhodomonas_salina.2
MLCMSWSRAEVEGGKKGRERWVRRRGRWRKQWSQMGEKRRGREGESGSDEEERLLEEGQEEGPG